MVDQAIALGVQGIIIQHGLTELMKEAAQRAVDAGIKVVAFDVNVENDKIPQIEQSDRDLARLALEQAIKDNGESWKAGYVYVAGIAPLDRRNETWNEFKKKYPGINEAAMFGTLDNPIANSVANQARSVLTANPDITVMFAPYDEFAKGVKIAVDEAGLSSDIKIYSADISTSDIAAMREPDSAWAATAATNPAVVGQVSVRALAQLLAGEDPGHNVIVPPTLITQKDLNDNDIKNMEELVGQAAAVRPCRCRDAGMDAAAKRQVNCPEIYGGTPFTPSGHNRDRGQSCGCIPPSAPLADMSPSRWPRSPSHGKCSRRFCG